VNSTPGGELEHRIQALQRHLRSHQIDVAFVMQNIDLFYFTGSMQSGVLIVPASGRPIYAVRRVLARAKRESALERVVPLEGFRQLPSLMRNAVEGDARRAGLELDVVPVQVKERVASGFDAMDWVDISAAVRTIRSIKSPYELEKIRAAAAVSALMVQTAAAALREGVTELELSGLIEAAARRAGHQGLVHMRGWNQEVHFGQLSSGEAAALQSFPDIPLAGEGPSPASPIGAGHRRIVAGEPVLLDYISAVDGYLCDQTRTLVIGVLPDKFARAHDAAVAVLTGLQAAVRPGMAPQDVHRRAIELAASLGYGEGFMGAGDLRARYIGHGVGLELDEWPVLAEGWTQPLEPGHVFCLEPKIVFPGEGAVGIEDEFVVTVDGAERLTRLEQRLFAV
jgi:Xaa-Pro aminopeptidase